MNRDREFEIIQKVGQNDFSDIDTMEIEELLFMIQCVRSVQKQSQGWNNNILEELAIHLKEKVKAYTYWYLIRSSVSGLAYIEDDRGFIFTDKLEAEKFISQKRNTAVNLEVYLYPLYKENIFSSLKRNGAEWVFVNKGKDGLVLETEQLLDSPLDISEEELLLTRQTNRLVFSKEIDRAMLIDELACQLANVGVYCALDKDGKIVAEDISTDNDTDDLAVTFVFSDKYEYENMYIPSRYERKHLKMESLFEDMADNSLLVINPNGANVAVDIDLLAALEGYIE